MIDDGDLDYAPDVLIVPSRLKRFEKVVSSTLAVNPSFLTKGSYATIKIGKRDGGGGVRRPLRERLSAELGSVEISPAAVNVKVEPKVEPSA